MAVAKTAISSHGEVDTEATEVYGEGKPLVRIGNGGAGATGLLKDLAHDFLDSNAASGSIHWICNHSRNSQLALLHGFVDIALTYERDSEALAVSEGWSKDIGCIFHDHFCLAGPESDPAGLRQTTSLSSAFSELFKTQALFHSRADSSATMWKERQLWSDFCGLEPWKEGRAETWYKTSVCSPAEALVRADATGAYLLTDRSTLLRQTALQTISRTTVFFEPESAGDVLMNSCHALIPTPSVTPQSPSVSDFTKYLLSFRGQAKIAAFGAGEVGYPFFARVDDEFAKTFLRGGVPRDGRWVGLSDL